ncbi:rhomboid family intramembrane serine protease [Dissulfurirhabdus thermomarina]|uniref:Rhomboid family intramembrane serine protease n=1 Tax=Dissulfurirhabdus thermomarina TaxID=1765737 RepID=A0A6N9TN44_DISTH|nr:rhomboid family intramembrane serine protease [Dissulfurirhabdus thermomarina]NDY42665.1 rhomboid family intramembrane serine protease [Dissulfurirhabdus thermomarina]NMX23440.1 rhomboid family intramembrane serine protease [Dissulfurirhabdus thermomarina]
MDPGDLLIPETPVSPEEAELVALVLRARGIPCRVVAAGGGARVAVRAGDAPRALREIEAYRAENPDRPAAPPAGPRVARPAPWAFLLVAGLLGWALLDPWHARLVEAGAADALRIRQGEWWRLVTALTLHADIEHLLANLAVGGLVLYLLAGRVGPAAAWCLALVSGTLGNLANALAVTPPHVSIGASTAVFGVIGALCGLQAAAPGDRRSAGELVRPVVAGVVLLAFLGTGGERTDVTAHLFGFLAGLAAGAAAGAGPLRAGPPGPRASLCLSLAAWVGPAAAWWAALR